MNKNISIQIKAALLLVVFSLNTIIGFACAIGLDMGFNTTHHHDEEAIEAVVHIHKDGKEHVHHSEAGKHHDEANNHKEKNDKDNCCHDKVIKFNEVDKSASHSFNIVLNPIFSVTFIPTFSDTNIFYQSYVDTGIKYFVRSHHPPISDVRIAIQSFQI